MTDRWIDRLSSIKSNAALSGIYELIHKVGNPRSAKSTVYQLSKKHSDFLWSHDGDVVKAVLPKAEPIEAKAMAKWKQGAERLNKSDAWPPEPSVFEGDVYEECLEELADLYNYIHVAQAKGKVSNKNAKKLLFKTVELYNLVRKANEFYGQDV